MAKKKKSEEFDKLPELWEAIKSHYQAGQVFRENIYDQVRETAGGHYGERREAGAVSERPINLLSLYVRIMTSHLVAADPRFMASTFDKHIRQHVRTFEQDGNRRLAKMKFGATLRRSVHAGLYGKMIAKVSLVSPNQARFSGYGLKIGEPLIQDIADEDFVYDIRASKWEDCDYMAHFYDALEVDVRESDLFDKEARKIVTAADNHGRTPSGDSRLGSISRGSESETDFSPKVRLCEAYLAREKLVITFDANGPCERPLLVQKWIGPDCGPYVVEGFLDVLGQLEPKGPISDLYDLHCSSNMLERKLGNQASEQKNIKAFRDATDAKKHQDAMDGGYYQTSDPNSVVDVSTAGPNQNVWLYVDRSMNIFSEHGGNLKVLGGLGQQADTATQEKLINENASGLVRAMGERVLSFTHGCLDRFGWYLWEHPELEMNSEERVPGTSRKYLTKVTPQDRAGKAWGEISLTVDPYSFRHATPASKLAILEKTMKETIVPLFPAFNQPGLRDALAIYLKMVAKLTNIAEVEELLEAVMMVQGPPADQEVSPEGQGMPQETTRTYERISKPGMTDEGNGQVLQQLMAGGQPSMNGQQGQGLGQMGRGGM